MVPLSKEALSESSNEQTDRAPKAAPRRKQQIKSSETEHCSERQVPVSRTISSGDSSDNRHSKRQVIAEVHSSQTQLLRSSSEDDILSERKEKKKKKKSKWKQISESSQLIGEGQENTGFQLDENTSVKSPSRLSNRSYTLETPTFLVEDIKLLTRRALFQDGFDSKDSKIDASPSRLSCKSYTVETPTFPVESTSKDEPVLPKIKTPIPLPRRKSLKSSSGAEGDGLENTPKKEEYRILKVKVESGRGDTIALVHQSPSQKNEESERDLSRSSAAVKHWDSASLCTEEDIPLSVRKQKKKKKRRKRSKSRDELELQELNSSAINEKDGYIEEGLDHATSEDNFKGSDLPEKSSSSADEEIVVVTVHGMDCPLVDPLVRHPMVRLHVIDTMTGEYRHKLDPTRAVCYYGESTGYIPPIMTHMYDFKQHRSVTPQWEERLVLNEPFPVLLGPTTLLLLEVCDTVPATVACSAARHHKLGGAAGWHVVAWAFLRPSGVAVDRARLQLYKPARPPKHIRPLSPVVYEWWGTADRRKYPGCLYVSVGSSSPLPPPSPRLRSQLPLQSEQGSLASVRSASVAGSVDTNLTSGGSQTKQDEKVPEVVWSRMVAQSCKLPNARAHSLAVDGSMCVRFSHNGLWLACARQEIQIYSVPQFGHFATLSGHQGLVYSLWWSSDDKILVSASADCTVCVWRPAHSSSVLLQMLGHPSFVYCAVLVPTRSSCSLVSGCHDGTVRLWRGETHSDYQLVQEMTGHVGYVTAVCVTVDGSRIVSADSNGSLRIYDVDDDGSLTGGRELRVREVRGTIVNSVVAHPGGHRLLVHLRDSTVRSVDIATGAVIQTFKGCTNDRMQTGMCVSACGGLVFACGEDGTLMAWDGLTGALRAVYCGLLPPGCATVHYHPHEHMLAVASLSQPPVHILTFDKNASGEDIGLRIVKNGITAVDVIEKMKDLHSSNKWQRAASKITASSLQASMLQDKNIFRKEKNKTGEKEELTGRPQSTNWPSLPQLGHYAEYSPGAKDLRLLEILEKMDSIILAAKRSSQS
ncbi:Jouberin [Homalodisca vitripennis]|nr:Jouberin [Homalodisca vitripennis]